jgi:hypothetical protein
MFYGKILIIVAFTVAVLGCTNEGTSQKKATFGHWVDRGSSTFTHRFQCVDEFPPHQNKEC